MSTRQKIHFNEAVWQATRRIPKGKVATYGIIAGIIGKPRAPRAVGTALSKNRSSDVPCHRVVRSDGGLAGFAWGLPSKIKRLSAEGVRVEKGKINLDIYGIRPNDIRQT